MAVTVTKYTDFAELKEVRAHTVGASEAAALFGVHPWMTRYGLHMRKAGLAPDDPDNAAKERGRDMESVAIRRIERAQPTWQIKQPQEHYADLDLRVGATPDLFAWSLERAGFGVVEVKTVTREAFIKTWQSESGVIEAPPYVAIQAIVQAWLTKAQWACAAALVLGYGLDLHMVDVRIHEGVIERLRSELCDFWRGVDEDHPPPPDYRLDGKIIASMYRDDDGSEVDLTGDNELPGLIADRKAASEAKSAADKIYKSTTAAILHRVGHAQRAIFAGGTISAKTVKREGYWVDPSTYRNLRIKLDKPEETSE